MNPLREIIERHLKISTICMAAVVTALPVACIWTYLGSEKPAFGWIIGIWLILFVLSFLLRCILLRCPSCGKSLQNLADFYKPSLFTLRTDIKCCPYCRADIGNSSSVPDSRLIEDFKIKNRFEKITLSCMFFAIIIAALSALYLNLQQKHDIDKANYNLLRALIEKGKYSEVIRCLNAYEGKLQTGASPGEALKTLVNDLNQEFRNARESSEK